jgi:hypothetical protein
MPHAHASRILGRARCSKGRRSYTQATTVAVQRDLSVPQKRAFVCEDDDDVRANSEALRELGYRVLEAHDDLLLRGS